MIIALSIENWFIRRDVDDSGEILTHEFHGSSPSVLGKLERVDVKKNLWKLVPIDATQELTSSPPYGT